MRRPLLFTTDLRFPLRLLAKRPSFTALTVLVLAGGLAVSLYTFAVLKAPKRGQTENAEPLP